MTFCRGTTQMHLGFPHPQCKRRFSKENDGGSPAHGVENFRLTAPAAMNTEISVWDDLLHRP